MAAIGIRGLGLVSSYGIGLARAVEGLRAGRDGITPLTLFELPFGDAIRVNQFDHGPFPPGEASAPAILEAAVNEALAAAGIGAAALREAALVIGTGGYLFAAEAEYRRVQAQTGAPSAPPLRAPGFVAERVAEDLGLGGPVLTLSTACSSSANALLVAADLIRRGEVRHALVLGVEGLSRTALSGFHSLMLLDPEGCRPFDRARRGMQLGEAVAAVLLEARADPAGDTLLGGANLCDIHHVTSAAPDGSAMRAVMELALADAGLAPADITVIKAHGTGSPDNDRAEAAAMRALFGERLPPFTGLKRYLGHTLGACGAVELAALLGCLRAGFVPPTAGCTQPDPELRVTPLAAPRPAVPGPVMLNFFGFGGNYASLIVRHA